jgi:vancomycin resistance protein YoaR
MKNLIFIIFVFVFLAFTPAKAVFASAPNGSFSFTYNGQTFNVSADTLASWQTPQTKLNLNSGSTNFWEPLLNILGRGLTAQNSTASNSYNLGSIYNYIQNLSSQIDVSAQEPVLVIQNNRVTQFTLPQAGTQVSVFQSSLAAFQALETGKNSSELVANQIPPQTSLSQTNSLGINQLIGEGVSNFAGSPNNRRHNIAAGIEKFKGLLIAPGATFSFDNNLGPVTADAGFLPELVIDNGTTLPELGGGLCQVSTTTFRAAMAAGLPITDRRNHAYPVSYYSPQGTDATIYPGSADLKFINNTPGTILIWPYEKDKNTLVFDFYGTDDGRKVTLEKPVVYDRKTDGSMKAIWTRLITSTGGQTATSTFYSNYQSPALFHKTETFVSATGTPISGLKMPTD